MEVLNDILGYKDRKIYQDTDCFSFSLDSIMLANFVSVRLNDKNILDLCTGNAVIPLVLSLRTKGNICGVELQKKIYDLAVKSVNHNMLNNQISIINDDINNFISTQLINSFDIITCNPPYFKYTSNSIVNETEEKIIARHEVKTNLGEILSLSKKLLNDGGNFAIVHRTDRFIEIIEEFRKNNIEPKRIRFVHESVHKKSTLILIEGSKNGKVGLTIEKPFILFNLDGTHTDEYSKFLTEVK